MNKKENIKKWGGEMKVAMKFLVLFLGVLLLVNVTYAESSREQLNMMIVQLQKNPNDNALREQIIKLAQTIKPALAVPETAEKFEGRAQFAFSHAKLPTDYLDAAMEYENAIAAAPWVPGYYTDLCTSYEKAEKYAEAKKNCEFFLASSPSAQDASNVRKRIAGLEFAIENTQTTPKSDKSFRDCPDCPEMVVIPAGSTIFAMGKYEVTQGQWYAMMGNHPSYF